jgi:hypothetical protein
VGDSEETTKQDTTDGDHPSELEKREIAKETDA